MPFTTNNTTTNPMLTIETNTLLKLSGSRSNPLDGEVRAKKISGPPNAITRDCDSRAVYAETIELADSTVRLYDRANNDTSGISS
jgi:hypothetical protein